MSKPLLCRIGIHQTFGDTVLTNIGTKEAPVYIADDYETCSRCDWSTDPNPADGKPR